MSSKAEAARINGARSNGPITQEGKATSSGNSLKHGLTSSQVVLPHESQQDYDRLEASIIHRFKPADELELELVREIASARWRLRRIASMETAVFRKALQQHQEALGPNADPADVQAAAYAEVAESKALRMLSRHQGQLRRAYEKAWREVELIQAHRASEEGEQNEPSDDGVERMIDQLMAMPLPTVSRPRLVTDGNQVLSTPRLL